MQNIKETIEYVCQVLQAFGIVALEPNHFRQAKHDHPKACLPFIKLIKSLLMLELFDFNIKCLEEYQDEEGISDEMLIALLKLKNCPYLLGDDNELYLCISSSKDLLLICGFLLAESSIFNRYNELVLYKSEEELNRLSRLDPKQTTPVAIIPEESQLNQSDPSNEMIRLYNITQQKIRRLKQLEKRKQSLHKKILALLESVNPLKLPLRQILRFTDEDYMREQINTLSTIQTTLLDEGQQQRHQEIFWNWMETVIDDDIREFKSHPSYGFPDQTLVISGNDRNLINTLKISLQQLQEQRIEFNQLSGQFEREWERVSILLTNDKSKTSSDKLNALEQQIPKIITQQNKMTKKLQDFIQESQQNNHYDLNQLLKDQIKLLSTVNVKKIHHKFNKKYDDQDQIESEFSGAYERLVQQTGDLNDSLKQQLQESTQKLGQYTFYPSFFN